MVFNVLRGPALTFGGALRDDAAEDSAERRKATPSPKLEVAPASKTPLHLPEVPLRSALLSAEP